MMVFPQSHVCPLALERNRFRCCDLTGKPNDACNICRAELSNELPQAMLEGDKSFFEMLFAGNILQKEGFRSAFDEEGGIQLELTRGEASENPGDCTISAVPLAFGGGYRLFIVIDDEKEIDVRFNSLGDVTRYYLAHREVIKGLRL